MRRRAALPCLGIFLLSACQTAVPPPPPSPPAALLAPSAASTLSGSDLGSQRPISITPFTAVTRGFVGTGGAFSGAYTRLVITSTVAAGGAPEDGQVLRYDGRHPIARFLTGRRSSLNLAVRISAGDFRATVPLATIERVSTNADGEGFARLVTHSAQNFPLFLVPSSGGGIVVSANFSLRATAQVSTSAAGMALKVAQDVAQAVSPGSAVLTSLTKQQVQNTAAALDDAIGKLFAMQITEDHGEQHEIGRWQGGGGIAISLAIPADEGRWMDTPRWPVGSWTIAFEAPFPSIFADVHLCSATQQAADNRCRFTASEATTAAYNSARPSAVLSFKLIGTQTSDESLRTVRAYLQQSDWFVAALNGFRADAGAAAIGQFCRNIRDAMIGLGLNDLDGDIVVKAVRDGMNLPSAVIAGMRSNPNCGRSI